MKEIISSLSKIYEKTGIEMCVYSALGELVYAPPSVALPFALPEPDEFVGNIAMTDSAAYLRLKRQSVSCYVVIGTGGDAGKNYALLIETMLSGDEELSGKDVNVEEKLRLLLAGELNMVQSNMLRAYFSDIGFNHYLLSLVTRTADMQAQLKHFLASFADKRDYIVTMDDRTLVYFRAADDESEEYHSAYEFAAILYENIKEELRIDLTVSTGGTIRNFHELSSCYEKVVFTYKFGRLLNPMSNVLAYKDYVLIRLLADVPKPQLIKYYDSLIEKNGAEIIADEELMDTAEEFMKNSLNISETSRNMYIHRNTLIYRLDKIEKETGLNLRVFSDAITFRLINILNTLIKGE